MIFAFIDELSIPLFASLGLYIKDDDDKHSSLSVFLFF